VSPFQSLPAGAAGAVAAEGERLLAFAAPEGARREVVLDAPP
jgi:hypothetical protein